jgi:hypothetical protein
MATSKDSKSPTRVHAMWLLLLESVILVGIALYLVLSAFVATVSAPAALVGEIVFALLGAIGLYFAARGFAQAKSFGRAPAVLANGIAMGVSYFMITGGLIWVGLIVGALGLATFVCSLFGYTE